MDEETILGSGDCVSITVSEPLTEGSTAEEWERLEWTEIGPVRCIRHETDAERPTLDE